jgi:hypothetical protein
MMHWLRRSIALAGLLCLAGAAHAFPLRSPQVAFVPGPMQAYLNSVDPGINVLTDQLAAPVWAASVTGNVDITLTRKNAGGQPNEVGAYNAGAGVPTLFQVFPPAAIAGWHATMHFAGGNMTVNLFDQNAVFLGSTPYPGVSASAFGFYTRGPCGLWFSQDGRNPNPQMLAYASPDIVGDYWLCWSACASDPG